MKKLLLGLLLIATPALAFDTYWHTAASAGAAGHFKFSPDATNILQFGTFGPDFFGPLYDSAGGKQLAQLDQMFKLRDGAAPARTAGSFMHFDNLEGEVDRNWKFDYLWMRLLDNTRTTIAAIGKDASANEGTKKLVTLLVLGSSLHMLEDFYSHSDWIHQDWVKLGFPQQQSEWGKGNDYAPSWFTVRAKLGAPAVEGPENWSFTVASGIYPPPKNAKKTGFGVPMTHEDHNHDNSALYYEDEDRTKFHDFGAHPASKGASDHQMYAVSSAAMAAVQWIELVEKNADAKAAIEDAKSWDLKKFNPAMQKDLESALGAVLMLSCFKHKWDGDKPAKAPAQQCSAANVIANVSLPMINEYWGAFVTNNLLEHLTIGIAGKPGHYAFDAAWEKAHAAQP
jgi:hypothetical protein